MPKMRCQAPDAWMGGWLAGQLADWPASFRLERLRVAGTICLRGELLERMVVAAVMVHHVIVELMVLLCDVGGEAGCVVHQHLAGIVVVSFVTLPMLERRRSTPVLQLRQEWRAHATGETYDRAVLAANVLWIGPIAVRAHMPEPL